MKFDELLMDIVRKDLDSDLIPMLLGEPGIGKSSWVEALANLMHTKCFTLACNQLADKADLTGARLVPDNKGGYKQVFYPHAVIADAIDYAKNNPRETPILFLDELNRTDAGVTSAGLSLATARTIGSASLPKNLKIVTAGNDKGNISSLDEASVSRFVLYKVEPDVNTFIAVNPELNKFIKNVLIQHPESIFCKRLRDEKDDSGDDDGVENVSIDDILTDGDDMNQITTPRTITALSKILNKFDNKTLLTYLGSTTFENGVEISVLQQLIESHVGHTQFSMFLLAEMSTGLMATSVDTKSTITAAKPSCYDELQAKATTDMTTLLEFIDNMTDNEKSGCIVYALTEKVDNSVIIKALAPAIDRLESNDSKTLCSMWAINETDEENVNTLMDTNTKLSNSLSGFLQTDN